MSKRKIDFNSSRKKLRKRKKLPDAVVLFMFIVLVYGVIIIRSSYKTMALRTSNPRPKNKYFKFGNFLFQNHDKGKTSSTSQKIISKPGYIPRSELKKLKYIVKNISEPVDHRRLGYPIGACMKDTATDLLYIFEKHSAQKIVKVYNDIENTTLLASHVIPYMWGGTGHVVLDGNVYFNKYNTSAMIKYNIETQRILAEKDLPDAGWGNRCSYKLLGSTDFDFSVDENNLWITYGSYESCNLTVSKLDPMNLEIIETWRTSVLKYRIGNSFMAKEVLYAVKTHEGYKNSIVYAYDTRKSEHFWPKIPILNKHGYISMLDYNYKEEELYAWDRGHLVTYGVIF